MTQLAIATALGVVPDIDPVTEAERRIAFLSDYLTASGATGYVLGISGGVDSTVSGRMAQIACERTGKTFTAMRLPYGEQADESDAQDALRFIMQDGEQENIEVVNIKPAVTGVMHGLIGALDESDHVLYDFVKGNVKARQRMVAQYAVAGAKGALVVGTDHAAEAVMGFFTKFGDGACDITPLAGLLKRQVRAIAYELGAPEHIITKAPTADLEDMRPGLKDEDVHGVSYAQIDAYLSDDYVGENVEQVIETAYAKTMHKREQPVGP